MRETDHAWAAGVIDGEGCIHIRRILDTRWVDGVRGTTGTTYKSHALTISVCQSGNDVPPMLSKLHGLYGGSISKPSATKSGRLTRSWVLPSKLAEDALRRMLPYLTEKRIQAEIALAYRANGVGRGRGEAAAFFAQALKDAKQGALDKAA